MVAEGAKAVALAMRVARIADFMVDGVFIEVDLVAEDQLADVVESNPRFSFNLEDEKLTLCHYCTIGVSRGCSTR